LALADREHDVLRNILGDADRFIGREPTVGQARIDLRDRDIEQARQSLLQLPTGGGLREFIAEDFNREHGLVGDQHPSLGVKDPAARRLHADDADVVALGGSGEGLSAENLQIPKARDEHAEHRQDHQRNAREPQARSVLAADHRNTSADRGRVRAAKPRTSGKTNGVSNPLYSAARAAARTRRVGVATASPSMKLNAA